METVATNTIIVIIIMMIMKTKNLCKETGESV